MDQGPNSLSSPSSAGSSPEFLESPLNERISAPIRREAAYPADQAAFRGKGLSANGSAALFAILLEHRSEKTSFVENATCSGGEGLYLAFASMIRPLRPRFFRNAL